MYNLYMFKSESKNILCKFCIISLLIITVFLISTKLFARNKLAIAYIHGNKILLERAISPKEREIGLMGREVLKDNTGMIFEFSPPQPVGFWMKNMKISLDMIFISNKKVVKIYNNVPICRKEMCDIYFSETPIDYVIEVPEGYCNRNGISLKQDVKINFN